MYVNFYESCQEMALSLNRGLHSNVSSPLQDTFGRAKTWVKELQRQASPNIVIALAGNKADLAAKRMVDYDVSSIHLHFNLLNWILGEERRVQSL